MQFSPGANVIYGFHGRCSVQSIEEKVIGGKPVPFYRLQIERPALTKATSKRKETAILIPVEAAERQGLRAVMTAEQCEELMRIFANREYYFPLEESWRTMKPKLEHTVLSEGATGSAKVISYLYTLINSHVVPPTDIQRFDETVRKPLVREIAEITEQAIAAVEEKINYAMRSKLRPDN